MRVKQLDWSYDDYDNAYYAWVEEGESYYKVHLQNKDTFHTGFYRHENLRWDDFCNTVDEAKSLCQGDYEYQVMSNLEECHPDPKQLFEAMAPIVRYGFNRACVELCEWINVDDSTFTFDELMDKLNDMISNPREMTSDDFLEYLKSEEE